MLGLKIKLKILPRIFLSEGWNLDLLHCRQILYHLNHQRSPNHGILEQFGKKADDLPNKGSRIFSN